MTVTPLERMGHYARCSGEEEAGRIRKLLGMGLPTHYSFLVIVSPIRERTFSFSQTFCLFRLTHFRQYFTDRYGQEGVTLFKLLNNSTYFVLGGGGGGIRLFGVSSSSL